MQHKRELAGTVLLLGTLMAAAAHANTERVFWSDFDAGLSAPPETWTWQDFPTSQCGDGSATGIGVNFTTASNRVLIYLAGGGACWNELTCYTFQTAAHFSGGYTQTNFSSDIGALSQPGGFFDRTTVDNPFRDYSYVVVPYCTGDLHAGDNVTALGTHTAHFVGHRNMVAYLRRLVDTFPNAGRIVLSGSSAGGFGATLNWWQTQDAFPSVRVDLINDSGTIMPEDVNPQNEAAQRAAWNLAATLPPGCVDCGTAYDAIWPFYASVFPNNRGALLSYDPDTVLPSYFGISSAQFSTGLALEETRNFDPYPTRRYFIRGAAGHALWTNPALTTNSVTLRQFLTQMVTDDVGWLSVKP